MKVLGLRKTAAGETIVETAVVHGLTDEPAQHAPAALKIIGIDRDDEDHDASDNDHDP